MQIPANISKKIIKLNKVKSLFIYRAMDRNNNSWPVTTTVLIQGNIRVYYYCGNYFLILSFIASFIYWYPCLLLSFLVYVPPLQLNGGEIDMRREYSEGHITPTAWSQLTHHSIRQPPTNGIISWTQLTERVAASAILFSFDVLRGQMRKPSIALSGLSVHDKRLGYYQSFSLIFPFQRGQGHPYTQKAVKQAWGSLLIIVHGLEFKILWGILCYIFIICVLVCLCSPNKKPKAEACQAQ